MPQCPRAQGQERLGIGLLGRQAGDVVADLRLGGDDLAASDAGGGGARRAPIWRSWGQGVPWVPELPT